MSALQKRQNDNLDALLTMQYKPITTYEQENIDLLDKMLVDHKRQHDNLNYLFRAKDQMIAKYRRMIKDRTMTKAQANIQLNHKSYKLLDWYSAYYKRQDKNLEAFNEMIMKYYDYSKYYN